MGIKAILVIIACSFNKSTALITITIFVKKILKMNDYLNNEIPVGISSCLLGEKVRYDGGHKKNNFITDVLSQYFTFKPFCPEMAIGLGVPRETIRLIKLNDEVRCVGTKSNNLDVTEQLYQVAQDQHHWHRELYGYILKKDSPSCGMERVKLYHATENVMPEKIAVGLYAKRLMDNFPYMPVEEEGRLIDFRLRENFIKRVFIYARWRTLMNTKTELTLAHLQKFHAQHKYIFMSHDQNIMRELGNLVANHQHENINHICEDYVATMMKLLKKIATPKNHVNTLKHLQGYLKSHIDAQDKEELEQINEQYRQGLLPLIVPITILRHHFRRHPVEYINDSYYLNPHPKELMLFNQL